MLSEVSKAEQDAGSYLEQVSRYTFGMDIGQCKLSMHAVCGHWSLLVPGPVSHEAIILRTPQALNLTITMILRLISALHQYDKVDLHLVSFQAKTQSTV